MQVLDFGGAVWEVIGSGAWGATGWGGEEEIVGGHGEGAVGGTGQGSGLAGQGGGYINVPWRPTRRQRAVASSYQGTRRPTLLPKPQAWAGTACSLREATEAGGAWARLLRSPAPAPPAPPPGCLPFLPPPLSGAAGLASASVPALTESARG